MVKVGALASICLKNVTSVFLRRDEDTDTQRNNHMKTEGEDGHVQAKEMSSEETTPDLRLLAS